MVAGLTAAAVVDDDCLVRPHLSNKEHAHVELRAAHRPTASNRLANEKSGSPPSVTARRTRAQAAATHGPTPPDSGPLSRSSSAAAASGLSTGCCWR